MLWGKGKWKTLKMFVKLGVKIARGKTNGRGGGKPSLNIYAVLMI